MTEDSKKDKKTLTLKKPERLELKTRVSAASVTRPGSKTATTVEVIRKRTFSRDGEDGKMKVDQLQDEGDSANDETGAADTNETAGELTKGENSKRIRALKENETRKEQEAVDEELRKKEAEEAAKRAAEEAEAAAAAAKEEPVEEVQEEVKEKPEEVTPDPAQVVGAPPSLADEDRKDKGKKVVKDKEKAHVGKPRFDSQRREKGKLTIKNALEQSERIRSMASIKRAREKAKRQELGNEPKESEKVYREVTVPEVITVQELANRMTERVTDVIRELMKMGMMVTASQTIDTDTAELIITEFGHTIKRVTDADVENILIQEDNKENLVPRPPVVTIMGHVDHGKTSLLDALRSTDVVVGEAGGITQHIGAYKVELANGSSIAFIDTPGHEAFTTMRMRGANVTDIVVLVVAADDGVMDQTIEAINHARAAEAPILVAVNKMDKPEADPSRVLNELLAHELIAESLGGDTIVVEVSALQKQNLDKLEEAILLQSEIMELKADPKRSAVGAVVEAKVDKARGVISTLLVQKGTLRIGDIVVAGTGYGRVRALVDDKGRELEEALPSTPVEILGLNEAPMAGDEFAVVETEKQAREITEYRKKRSLDLRVASEQRHSLEQLFTKAQGAGVKELPIVIKADVHGSAEAITESLRKIESDEVQPKIIHSAVGGITESDISLAQASNALILGFNVRATAKAKELSEKEGVDIRYYSVIYSLVDDMKAVLSGMLAPALREEYLGTADIREVFNMSKHGKVAGCFVTDGMIKRGASVRLLRDNIVIYEGSLKTLRRFKDDVKEVSSNFECGMALENYEDIKEGDKIEAFELIEEARKI